jgi:RNA polymerase sigma-70 factor (ECF subfamily)
MSDNSDNDMAHEQTLLARARAFDMSALAEVYDTFSPAVYRYAMRLLGDASLAEECVTETFSRLLGALKGGGGPTSFLKAYLFRTAHNWMTDYFRQQGHANESLDAMEEAETFLADDRESLLQGMVDRLNAKQVREALRRLTADQRQVIVLRFYEDLSSEEVAAALNKPVGAVKALQHRALGALRRALGASMASVNSGELAEPLAMEVDVS